MRSHNRAARMIGKPEPARIGGGMVLTNSIIAILRMQDRSVDWLNPLGSAATQSSLVAAVENTAPSPGDFVGTRGTRAAGE